MFNDTMIIVAVNGLDESTDGPFSQMELLNYTAMNLIASAFVFTNELNQGLATFAVESVVQCQVVFRGQKNVIAAIAERAAQEGHVVAVTLNTPLPEPGPEFLRSIKHWSQARIESYAASPACTEAQLEALGEELEARANLLA